MRNCTPTGEIPNVFGLFQCLVHGEIGVVILASEISDVPGFFVGCYQAVVLAGIMRAPIVVDRLVRTVIS